jgi:Rieske Fe-S protein
VATFPANPGLSSGTGVTVSPPGYSDYDGDDSIYIVKSGSGYIAYSLSCRPGCIVIPSGSGWQCPCHDATFDANGMCTGGLCSGAPGGANLQRYPACADANGVTITLQ